MDRRNQTIESATRASASVITAARARTATPTDGGTHSDFTTWLIAGRVARSMTREQVAKVTRIQLRTIERLEEGRFDELPADVFVRGFIRNYARCVGLSVDEALARYGACGFEAAPVASPQALALLDTMAPLSGRSVTSSVTMVRPTPSILTSEPAVAPAAPETAKAVELARAVDTISVEATRAVVRPTRTTGGGSRERDAKGRFIRRGTASAEMEAVAPPDGLSAELLASFEPSESGRFDAGSSQPILPSDATSDATSDEDIEIEVIFDAPVLDGSELVAVAPPPPLFAASVSSTTTVRVPQPTPTLVIDDDDPEEAEREREQRAKDREESGGWRSFLPPALLDQDRGRQGGLTLAVIILLIVATLTLSYLMRRPSSTGEGVTAVPTAPTTLA